MANRKSQKIQQEAVNSFLHNFYLLLNREQYRRRHGKLLGFYKGLTLILNYSDPDVIKLIIEKDFHYLKNHKVNSSYSIITISIKMIILIKLL